MGLHKLAIERHLKDLDIAQQLLDKPGQERAYYALGNAYYNLGRYKRAVEYHKKELEIAEQLGDRPGQGRAYNNIGVAYRDMGLYTLSIEHHQKDLDIAEQLDDKLGQGDAINSLGIAYKDMGLYALAIAYFQRCLDIAQQLGDKSAQGAAYCSLGNAHDGMGQHKVAIEYHNKDLDIAQQLDDKPGQGRAYCNIGNAYYGLGQYKTAIEHLEKLVDIAQQLGHKPRQGAAYGNLGCAYEKMGQYETAIDYHSKLADIAQELDDKPEQGRAYANLGKAHAGLGRYQAAIGYLRDSIAIAEELDIKPFIMDVRESFGQVYLEMGDPKQAVDHFTQLGELAEDLGLEIWRCSALSGLGSAHLRMGQHSVALSYHEKELHIAQSLEHEPSVARAYSGLGCAYMQLHNYARAIECHEKDRAICERLECWPGLKRAHGSLGDVCKRQGDYAKAIEHYQEYLTMTELLGDRPAQARAQASLGLERFRSGNPALAFRHFTKFEHLLSELEEQLTQDQWRRHLAGFVDNYAECMDAWVVAAAQAGDMLEALRVEEWRRCRSEQLCCPRKDGTPGFGLAGAADASFVIVFKVYENNLMTWVLSGESGQLVYDKLVDVRGHRHRIPEWVSSVSFSELSGWLQAFAKARDAIEHEEEAHGRPVGAKGLEKIAERVIPDSMKGDLRRKLWASIRDARTFPETVCGLSREFEMLESHFFQKADTAMEELSKLLLGPILKEFPGLERNLRGEAPCIKPVRAVRACVFRCAQQSHSLLFFFLLWLHQISFVPDSSLSTIPFCALKIGGRFLIEKAPVTQASSLHALISTRMRWDAICSERSALSKGGKLTAIPVTEILVPDSGVATAQAIERVASGSGSLVHFLAHTGHTGKSQSTEEDDWAETSEMLARKSLERCIGQAHPSLGGAVAAASKQSIPTVETVLVITRVYALMALNKVCGCETVAEALQAAVLSLLADKSLCYNRSFFYWAPFASDAFAGVQLDDALLEQIRTRLSQAPGPGEGEGVSSAMTMLALTQGAYRALRDRKHALASEWCSKRHGEHWMLV